MQDAVFYAPFDLPVIFGLTGGDTSRPATVTLANLVAVAFLPIFILRVPTIDCEHEHYSKIKIKQGPVSCVNPIGLLEF
jgi:hypothetical protein